MDDERANRAGKKIGVFYDGGWFTHLSDYCLNQHPIHTRPAIQGIHDAVRWYLAHSQEPAHQMSDYEVVEAHYVRGRHEGQNVTSFERALHAVGVQRHDVTYRPGQEKGADVELALQMSERAAAVPLDVVVLLSGDADLVPAVDRLTRHGVHVLVPWMHEKWQENGRERELATARQLADRASEAPGFLDLLYSCLDDEGYPGFFPFVAPTGDDTYGPVHAGRITRWREDEPWAFLVDSRGQSWWMSKDSFLGNLNTVTEGARVEFQGSPKPQNGRKVPTAYSVRMADTTS